jgi:hypothetical protein
MDDPRFEWNNRSVLRYHEQRRREVETYAASLPSLEAVRRALDGWWRGTGQEQFLRVASNGGDEVGRESLASAVSALADQPLATLIAALPLALAPHDREVDVPRRLARRLLAESLGRIMATGPVTANVLVPASEFAHERLDDWFSFRASFLSNATATPERQRAWVDALCEVPNDIARYVNVLPNEGGVIDHLREREAAFKVTPNADEALRRNVWDLRIDDALRVQYDILLALDAGAWARTLDRIPSTPVMREFVECSFVWKDRDRLLIALREALPAFEGDQPTGNRAVFACIDAIAEHGTHLDRVLSHAMDIDTNMSEVARIERERVRSAELPGWFREAYATVLGRTDGVRTSVEYAVILAGRTESEPPTDRTWSANMAAFEALVEVLEVHGVFFAHIRAIARATQRPSELPFLLLGIAVELRPRESDPAWAMGDDEVRAEAWTWYMDLLQRSDERILLQVNPYSVVRWPFLALGAVLAGWADPTERWNAAWRSLFDQRERARFSYTPRSLEPSLHLSRVGCGALDVSRSVRDTSGTCDRRLQLLWNAVTRSLMFLTTGQAGQLLQLGLIEFAGMFAYLPHVFGSEWRREAAGWWTTLAADERLLLRAIAHLLRNTGDRDGVRDFLLDQRFDLAAAYPAALFAAKVDPEPNVKDTIEAAYTEVAQLMSPPAGVL